MKNIASKSTVHPLSLARMLWKHRLLAVVIWLASAGTGILIINRLPKIYQAESLVLVDSQKIPERFVAATVQVSLQDHLAMISQQILSTTELDRLIEKYRLYEDLKKTKSPEQIIDQMRKDTKINLERGWGMGRSGAFRVIYQGRQPTVVANVVNDISGMFIAANLKAREIRAEGTSKFIETQLEEARKNLEEQEANYSRFKLKRMGELPEQEAAMNGTLNRLQAELQGTQDAINRAEQNQLMNDNALRVAEAAEGMALRALREASTVAPAAQQPRRQEPAVTGTAPVVRQSDVLRRQLAQLQARYQDEHPDVRRARQDLDAALKQEALEASLQAKATPAPSETSNRISASDEARAAVVSPQLRADLNRERERVAAIKIQLELAKKELQARNADRVRILRSIGEYQGRLERLPVREQEMASITRDYENSKQNYRSLMDKKASAVMAAEMEHQQQAERFTLQDPARVPTQPIKPNRLVLGAGAIAFGLFLGVACALGIELRRNRLLGEWELPAGVAVLGRVPMIALEDGPRAVEAASNV